MSFSKPQTQNPKSQRIRVYYEDTDSGGVVYYANYLKFLERARTELLRDIGINQSSLEELFVVKNVNISFISPARLDDLLEVKTEIKELKPASIIMNQVIEKDGKILVKAEVEIVCVNKTMKPTKIPEKIRVKLV